MTAASLLSALSLQVPFLLIPPLFDLASAGQYFLAYRVLILPASLVGAAVSQVFFGEASFRRDDVKRLEDLARNAAASLFAFSIPTYTIVIVGGPTLIEAVFGGQWALAGLYAQIMAPSLIIWSVASPISSLLLVGRREVESLAFTAVSLALEAGAFLIGAWCQSLTAALVFLSATSVLTNGAALWRFLRVAHVGLRQLAIPVARILLLTLPSLALVALVVFLAPGGILPAAALGWMLAVLLSARFSPEFRALLSGSHD
jgi:O-antigen/teichoic acid export membrane protein